MQQGEEVRLTRWPKNQSAMLYWVYPPGPFPTPGHLRILWDAGPPEHAGSPAVSGDCVEIRSRHEKGAAAPGFSGGRPLSVAHYALFLKRCLTTPVRVCSSTLPGLSLDVNLFEKTPNQNSQKQGVLGTRERRPEWRIFGPATYRGY